MENLARTILMKDVVDYRTTKCKRNSTPLQSTIMQFIFGRHWPIQTQRRVPLHQKLGSHYRTSKGRKQRSQRPKKANSVGR